MALLNIPELALPPITTESETGMPINSFVMATANIGTNGHPGTVMESADVIAWQEASDQTEKIKAASKEHGFHTAFGIGKDSGYATPLSFRKDAFDPIRKIDWLMVHRQFVGKGAGPEMLKTKFFVGSVLEHKSTGAKLVLGSTHYVASSYTPIRRKVAIKHSHALAVHSPVLLPIIAGADWNCEPDSPILQPLKNARWTFSQNVLGPIPTHGRRSIDGLARHNGNAAYKVHFKSHRTLNFGSDHMAYLCTLGIEH